MLNKIDHLLEIHPDLEELFEVLDITPYVVIKILLEGGHVVMPEYLLDRNEEDDDGTY